MSLFYEDAGLRLWHGSNLDLLPTFEDASFDSIVTDPPYELSNDGKASPARVLTEFMFPEKAEVVAETPCDVELPRLIAQILRLGDGGRFPAPPAAMPVGAVALNDKAAIGYDDVEDGQEGAVSVADGDALVDQEPESPEYVGCFQFELADSAQLLKVLGEVGCGFQSGGLGVGLRVGSPGLPGLLASCAAVVCGREDVGSYDDTLTRLVGAFSTAGEGAVLSLRDLSGASEEVLTADGAFVLLSLALMSGAVLVRATPGARRLSTKLQACRVRVVDDTTHRALTFDLLVHPTSLSSVGFMGKGWDGSKIAYDVNVWRECLRVLKPGGHLLAFGGTRTWHRIAVAIEDAGFEVRDSIAWLYGSGFPKSMNVAKAIASGTGRPEDIRRMAMGDEYAPSGRGRVNYDHGAASAMNGTTDDVDLPDAAREWEGWGTALKPAFEPVVVARKPLIGTVAANVLEHGTGALNIDATRIGYASEADRHANDVATPGLRESRSGFGGGMRTAMKEAGRWPANVVLDDSQAAALDEQSGYSRDGTAVNRNRTADNDRARYSSYAFGNERGPDVGYGGGGGASRFFPTFRYEAKAPTSERPNVDGTVHATVKPLELMRWLIRLVTRPGGRVLDPFAGSGTTGEAALLEGMECDLIELEADHLPLILQRVRKPLQPSMFGDWDGAA